MPGVEAAALARTLPLGDSSNSNGPILKEGETLARGSAGRNIMTNVVSSGYFKTMQIPILEGRDFDDRDQPENSTRHHREPEDGPDALAGRERGRQTHLHRR